MASSLAPNSFPPRFGRLLVSRRFPCDSLISWLWKRASVEHDWKCAKNRILLLLCALSILSLSLSLWLSFVRPNCSLSQKLSPLGERALREGRERHTQTTREKRRERERQNTHHHHHHTIACAPDSLSLLRPSLSLSLFRPRREAFSFLPTEPLSRREEKGEER